MRLFVDGKEVEVKEQMQIICEGLWEANEKLVLSFNNEGVVHEFFNDECLVIAVESATYKDIANYLMENI